MVNIINQPAICRFNTQPPEGGWFTVDIGGWPATVSTHSRPKAAGTDAGPAFVRIVAFQHTAARRRLAAIGAEIFGVIVVSTHSRPKAAGVTSSMSGMPKLCFNTQPPEGGWIPSLGGTRWNHCFNTQPPEGGWVNIKQQYRRFRHVSTHSRPKAAGRQFFQTLFHFHVSTHSRPKAAGTDAGPAFVRIVAFQHTAARRRLGPPLVVSSCIILFQHTAARRRLVVTHLVGQHIFFSFNTQPPEGGWDARRAEISGCLCFNTQPPEGGWSITACPYLISDVSTHSRPKAAGGSPLAFLLFVKVSTHSRPKAAGCPAPKLCAKSLEFQHTAARRRLGRAPWYGQNGTCCFNTQPPEGGWLGVRFQR